MKDEICKLDIEYVKVLYTRIKKGFEFLLLNSFKGQEEKLVHLSMSQ